MTSAPSTTPSTPPGPAPAGVGSRGTWVRMLICQAVQLPAVALVLLSPHPAAWWAAGVWGSCCCCAGTDSQWRWRNRALLAQAVAWLVLAAVFGSTPSRLGAH